MSAARRDLWKLASLLDSSLEDIHVDDTLAGAVGDQGTGRGKEAMCCICVDGCIDGALVWSRFEL